MAPEQMLGPGQDHRADVFALGVILYQLLTGRQPFEAANPSDTGVRIAQHTPPPPSHLAADVPPELDAIVVKALAKSVGDRYDNAATMAADLRAVASAILQREAGSDVARAVGSGPARNPRGRLLLLVTLLLAALAVTGWSLRDRAARAWKVFDGVRFDPVIAVVPFSVGGGDVVARLPGIRRRGRTGCPARAYPRRSREGKRFSPLAGRQAARDGGRRDRRQPLGHRFRRTGT